MPMDGNRCIITGAYDLGAAEKALETTNVSIESLGTILRCEAAHIIPHSSNKVDATRELVISALLLY